MGKFLKIFPILVSIVVVLFVVLEWKGVISKVFGYDNLERYTKFIATPTIDRTETERRWVEGNVKYMENFIKRHLNASIPFPGRKVLMVDRLMYDNLPVMNLPSGTSTFIPLNAPVFFIYKFPPEAKNDDVIQVTSLDKLNTWIERGRSRVHFIFIDVIIAIFAIVFSLFSIFFDEKKYERKKNGS